MSPGPVAGRVPRSRTPAAPAPAPTEPEGPGVAPALRALGLVGPPVTVATGLLFYFGWARSAQQAEAMGLDESVFAMSTRDYVLRSVDSLYVPVLAGSAVVLAGLVVHAAVLRRVAVPAGRPAVRQVARRLAAAAWLVLPLLAALAVWPLPDARWLVVPLGIGAGVVVTEYALRLLELLDRLDGHAATRPAWVASLRGVVVGVLVTAALFWEVTEFAGVVGRGRADEVERSVGSLPAAVVYSKDDLHLEWATLHAQRIGDEGSAYRFRYSGAHLLQHSGGTWFLLPDGWHPGTRPLVVLPESSSVRLEFVGPPR
ncbi:hypothetical protein CLV35_1489 [Motilibacter peucedani]|uniref:Uncharacterized protein n=1 Tax=Motilibacter peucedani TaxID=598650 RepID=A0A420XSJ8_9ACTN|nr:hypothetical protein [Motilibacter peucedani]RKS77791.1 hypothetical protein CLV35_1489 [Motilibacter peucedani]